MPEVSCLESFSKATPWGMSLQPVPTSVLVALQTAGRQFSGLQVSKIDPCSRSMDLTVLSAGISIGVGLLRILFPESKQFIEAKKAGKKTANAAEFWKETRVMLAKEWRMCIYCIILMTWVSSANTTSQGRPRADTFLQVQLLLPHLPRFIHHLHAHPKRA